MPENKIDKVYLKPTMQLADFLAEAHGNVEQVTALKRLFVAADKDLDETITAITGVCMGKFLVAMGVITEEENILSKVLPLMSHYWEAFLTDAVLRKFVLPHAVEATSEEVDSGEGIFVNGTSAS